MKKLFLGFIIALTFLCVDKSAQAFEIGDLSGKVSLNLLRTNEDHFNNRINILPHAEYKRLFFKGDYNLDFNDDKNMTRTQQKSTVGVKLVDELSVRYQFENYDTDTFKIVKGVEKVGNKQWYDNRIGAGYALKTSVHTNSLKTNIVLDIMALAQDRDDYRTEYNISFDNKYFRLHNQLYYDYVGWNMTKYYDRIIFSYKITPNFHVNSQINWVTDKKPTQRLGVTITF